MSFVFSCLFYSLIGCVIGFFAHIFNGVVQTQINFNWKYFGRLVGNFGKAVVIMTLATLVSALLILMIPQDFLGLLGVDIEFFYQLVFYLVAFAAFDFGVKN